VQRKERKKPTITNNARESGGRDVRVKLKIFMPLEQKKKKVHAAPTTSGGEKEEGEPRYTICHSSRRKSGTTSDPVPESGIKQKNA